MSQMNVAKKTFKKGGIVKPKKYIVGGGKADNVSITNKADLEKKQLGEQEANNLNSQTINVPEGKVEEFMNSPEYRGEIVQPIPDKMETIPEAKAIAAAPETPEAPAADAGGGMAGMAGGIGGAVASIFTDKRKMTQFGLTEEQLSDKSHKKMAKGGVVKYAGKNKLVGKVKSTDEDVYKVGNNDYGKIKFKTTPTPTPAISTSSQPTKPAILSDNTVKIASIPTPTSVSSNGVAPKTNSADLINRTTPKSTPSTVTKASQADIDSLEKRVRAKRSSAENKAVNAGRA
jgi:hypothetical protein